MAIDIEHPPVGAKLELYISPSCPYCREALAHYDRSGIAYVKHDAHPTVPAIVIDGSYIQSGWGHPPRG